MDRTTRWQTVLLILVFGAGAGVAYVVKQESAAPPEIQSYQAAEKQYIQRVTAVSDSLHDRAENLLSWWVATEDTSGLAARNQMLLREVDKGMAELQAGSDILSPEEYDLLMSLLLDYLEVAELTTGRLDHRGASAEAFLRDLETSRARIEGRLVLRVGRY